MLMCSAIHSSPRGLAGIMSHTDPWSLKTTSITDFSFDIAFNLSSDIASDLSSDWFWERLECRKPLSLLCLSVPFRFPQKLQTSRLNAFGDMERAALGRCVARLLGDPGGLGVWWPVLDA